VDASDKDLPAGPSYPCSDLLPGLSTSQAALFAVWLRRSNVKRPRHHAGGTSAHGESR
jgi:hypothetical protein